MYLKFFFSVFFSVKVLAVPPGEVFWEVVKPGVSTPNYLLGTSHYLPFSKDSLPAELVMALKNSKEGLFEVIFRERTGDYFTTLKKRTTWLPDGETLSSYIGEKRTQEIFTAIQFALSQLDEGGTSFLSEKWKKFDLTLTSYEDFNNLRPRRVFTIERFVLEARNRGRSDRIPHPPILHKPQMKLDRKKDSVPTLDMKKCLLRSYSMMDTYIEKVFSCMGKPVHSLESTDENLPLILSSESKKIAARLVWDSDKIIRRLRDQESSGDILHEEWGSFLNEIAGRVRKDLNKGHYLNHFVDTAFLQSDIVKTISMYLMKKECSVLSDSLINQYAWGIINMRQLRVWFFSKGEQMTGTTEEELAWLISETGLWQREIFSLCFPDFQWPEDLEEIAERANQLQLDSIKSVMELLVIPRDLKQAQSMHTYFEKGGAFAAVGFSHLTGVLRKLRTQGYEVKEVPFSTPFKVPPASPLYELLKRWDENKVPRAYGVEIDERTDDIYSNPAKVEQEEGNPYMN